MASAARRFSSAKKNMASPSAVSALASGRSELSPWSVMIRFTTPAGSRHSARTLPYSAAACGSLWSATSTRPSAAWAWIWRSMRSPLSIIAMADASLRLAPSSSPLSSRCIAMAKAIFAVLAGLHRPIALAELVGVGLGLRDLAQAEAQHRGVHSASGALSIFGLVRANLSYHVAASS